MSDGEHEDLNWAIIRVARRHRYRAGQILGPVGLHPGQEAVLRSLNDEGEQSQTQLATMVEVEPPTVHRSLVSLERAGLVCRRPSERDGRITVVSLTEAGRVAHAEVAAAWQKLAAETTAGFTAAERAELVRLLGRAGANLGDPDIVGDC